MTPAEQWEAAKALARQHRQRDEQKRRRKLERREPPEVHGAPRRLLAIVAEVCELRLVSLLGPRKTKSVVEARQLAYLMLRSLLGMSLTEIGAACGGRDHTTVMSGARRAARRRESEPSCRAQADAIERRWNQADAAE